MKKKFYFKRYKILLLSVSILFCCCVIYCFLPWSFHPLGELLLYTICVFFIVVLIYRHRKIWEIYLSRTSRIKRRLWIVALWIVLIMTVIIIHYILRMLIVKSFIVFEIHGFITELDFVSYVSYLYLSILYSTFFFMAYTFIRCVFPKWLSSWGKQKLAILYILLITLYTIALISYYEVNFVLFGDVLSSVTIIVNYIVDYSYMFVVFIFIFYIMAHIAGWRMRWMWKNNVLRRKIAFIFLLLIVFSFIVISAVTILIYNFTGSLSSVISTYANVYVLLFIITFIVSMVISNSITRPLDIIRQNIENFERTNKIEVINYHASDELGSLVRSYNDLIGAIQSYKRKLVQVERDNAWREMARKIAHEIKNPLTPMRLSIQHILRLKRENNPKWQDRIEEVSIMLLEQIDRLSIIATEFSSFSKVDPTDFTVVDLNDLIEEELLLFKNYSTIKFTLKSNVKPAQVNVHVKQIRKVFVNLFTNAIDAIGEHNHHGQIIITLYEKDSCYYVSVEDNGCGVSEEIELDLFTLNFTTKRRGSGLGLPICRSIMESHNGRIGYSPSSIGGACFTLVFPKKK